MGSKIVVVMMMEMAVITMVLKVEIMMFCDSNNHDGVGKVGATLVVTLVVATTILLEAMEER